MGKWRNTADVYAKGAECDAREEKLIPEKDRMCLATAFVILHAVRDNCRDEGTNELLVEALETLFRWIEEIQFSIRAVDGELYDSH